MDVTRRGIGPLDGEHPATKRLIEDARGLRTTWSKSATEILEAAIGWTRTLVVGDRPCRRFHRDAGATQSMCWNQGQAASTPAATILFHQLKSICTEHAGAGGSLQGENEILVRLTRPRVHHLRGPGTRRSLGSLTLLRSSTQRAVLTGAKTPGPTRRRSAGGGHYGEYLIRLSLIGSAAAGAHRHPRRRRRRTGAAFGLPPSIAEAVRASSAMPPAAR